MPSMWRVDDILIIGYRRPKCDFGGVQIVTAVHVVVNHKLQKVLQVRFIWLEFSSQYNTLLQKVGQPRHDNRVEHVDLEKESITNMKAVERNAFHKGYPGDKLGIVSILISSVAHG